MPKLFIFFLCLGLQVQAQDTTHVEPAIAIVDTTSADQTLDGLRSPSYAQPLLPPRMLFTQRVFWGTNGLLRVMQVAPLTAEGRHKEVKIRQFMLVSHQVTGYITLAGLVMQGILAAKANKATGARYDQLYGAQRTITTITNIAYGTTALLSLTAPPKPLADRKTRSGARLHGYLSIIHLTGIVMTNVLAGKAARHSDLRPYHQVAAFTTLAALTPALIALKF